MSRFIRLDVIEPIMADFYFRKTKDQDSPFEKTKKLSALRKRTIFVNGDAILRFEDIELAYPDKEDYYSFLDGVKDSSFCRDDSIFAIENLSGSLIKIEFENLANHRDKFMSKFDGLTFITGVVITFKPELSPLGSNRVVYVKNSHKDLLDQLK